MLFLLAIAMAVLGIALCIKGALKLPGGRQLKPIPSRIAGGFLLSFLPLVMLIYVVIAVFEIRHLNGLYQDLINWSLALSCLGTALVIMWMCSTIEKQTNKDRTKYSAPSSHKAGSQGAANSFLVDHPQDEIDVELVNDPLVQHAQEKSKGRLQGK